jgi:hypothetical protein
MRSALFAALAGAAVLAAIVCGFAVTGSPETARLQALDARRVDDLRELADAADGNHTVNLRDPQTGVPYTYVREGAGRYRICATFSFADSGVEPAWLSHHAGRQCFEREGASTTSHSR